MRTIAPESIVKYKEEAKNEVACTKLKVKGGEFKVVARNLSRENKYVKSVTLNGKPITDWKIRHSDIMRGGDLVFEMTNASEHFGD